MARDEKRSIGIAWDPDPGFTTGWEYIVFVDETDDPEFLAKIDTGEWPETDRTTETQWLFPVDHPTDADHAVVSTDNDGRFSDPHQPAGWQDIPLSRPPLAGVSGGRVLSAGGGNNGTS